MSWQQSIERSITTTMDTKKPPFAQKTTPRRNHGVAFVGQAFGFFCT
jgi:hypothetical protein